MPSFYNLVAGAVAQAQDVQQVLDALKGTAGLGIPLSPTAVNDSVNFAVAIKNTEVTNSRALQVLRANNLVLVQADANGVVVSPDGVSAAAQVVNLSLAQTLTNKTMTAPTLTSPHFTSPVVDSGGMTVNGTLSIVGAGITANTGDITGRRFKTGGTGLVNGDFAISAGWGNTATVLANSNSQDGKFTFTVTCGGTGIAANPTVTLTFKDGTWTVAPMVLCQLTGGTGAGGTTFGINASPTTTTVPFQMFFTPTTGLTYQFTALVIG